MTTPAMPANSPWTRADTAWIVLFALLMLATTLSALFGTAVDDTWRDIYFAHRIAYGEEYPLRGPVIGNIAQLGPVWFYLLAPAYALGGVAGALAMLGVLSGLKYPLAFALGRRVGGTGLGVAFGLAWLMPLWNTIETGWPTHISAVSTSLLALALASLAYRRGHGLGWAFGLGLLAALAVHAHPTTALLASLLVAYALAALPTWRSRFVAGLVAVSGALLFFVPVIVASLLQIERGPDNLIGLGSHAGQLPLASVAERFLPVLRGLFWGPAEMQWPVLLGLSGGVLDIALTLTGVSWALLALGWGLARSGQRRVVWLLLFLVLLQTAFVLALRPITPFWMSFAHGPLLMALIGIGAWSLWSRHRAWRVALIVPTLAMGAGLLLLLWRLAVPGTVTFAPVFAPGGSGFLSISERVVDRHEVQPIRIAPTAWERLGATLCGPSTIFGHFASLVDVSFALGARRACGHVEQIALGGTPTADSQRRIGLSAKAARAIGVVAPTRAEGLRLFSVDQVFSNGEALSIVAAGRYPRRDLSHFSPRRFDVEAVAGPAQVLAIGWRGYSHHPITVHAVHANDMRVEPVYTDSALWLYRCNPCIAGQPVRWRIDIDAVPELIDVVSFDPAAVVY